MGDEVVEDPDQRLKVGREGMLTLGLELSDDDIGVRFGSTLSGSC